MNPAPGSVDLGLANGAAVPGDVRVKLFSYGYKVKSKLKDYRANPFEPVFLVVKVTSTNRACRCRQVRSRWARRRAMEECCSAALC